METYRGSQKYKEYHLKYDKENSDTKKLNTKEYYRRKRKAVIEMLGGKCLKCGFSDFRALQIDHINGNGLKDKKSITRMYWTHIMESFLKKENKYQLLCANCNWIKRFENNEVRGGLLQKII